MGCGARAQKPPPETESDCGWALRVSSYRAWCMGWHATRRRRQRHRGDASRSCPRPLKEDLVTLESHVTDAGAAGNHRQGRNKMMVQLHPVAMRVAELLEPHVERQGFDLVSVEYHKGTRSSLLRLLVDRPGGGIALSDLEQLSPLLGDLLDVYDPIEGRYTLEVASPGVNRPLVRLGDFEAFVGQRVRIKTHRAMDGQKSFTGLLASVSAEGVEIEDEPSRRRVSIGFSEMKGANHEYDFDGAGRR
jgi:ribosome maturation factor RimP